MHFIKELIKQLEDLNTSYPLNLRGKAKLKEYKYLLELAEREIKNESIDSVIEVSYCKCRNERHKLEMFLEKCCVCNKIIES